METGISAKTDLAWKHSLVGMHDKKIIHVIDSHTEGEPTRVVLDGGPTLSGKSILEKRDSLSSEHDWLRTACLCEPRGHAAMVGAMLCDSDRSDCVAGVIFFNNVGYLNGCVHGTIGIAQTLVHLGRISKGEHGIETPSGRVTIILDGSGSISVRNVHSYRYASAVDVDVPGFGTVSGDVAWGGNWFFLVDNKFRIPLDLEFADELTNVTTAVRQGLNRQGITGDEGAEIDHIEVFDTANDLDNADSKNFVLCPGNVYDRSPCGTGSSAKIACLFANGNLQPGSQIWRQAGILDTVFHCSFETSANGGVIPTISGKSFVNGESKLIIDPSDPFRFGISHQPSQKLSSENC